MKKQRMSLWALWLALACVSLSFRFAAPRSGFAASASEGQIAGVVTDDAGKPLRGAPVTASMGNMSVSRYSDSQGRYQIIGLKPGTYKVSATAWGYGTKTDEKEITGATEMQFSLKPNWNPQQISTAEYITAFGNDKDIRKVESTCTGCHNFSWIMRRRGMTADEWSDFIPRMGDKFVTPKLSPAQLKEMGPVLEKYFGPDAPLPTKDNVQHVEISDEALNATFRMYKPPTPNIDHSLHVGSKGQIWFTEFDNFSNKIAMFDNYTQEFQEYDMPSPKAGPHNPWVARNGMVWITEINTHKLAVLNPETRKITEYPAPNGAGIHTIREDSQGNIWTSGVTGGNVTKFDPRTEKFTVYDKRTTFTYDLGLDSHDNAWGAGKEAGGIFRVDSTTGDIKVYSVADMNSVRGVEVDSHDNVWIGDVTNHRLGKFDPKTEQLTYYHPPTANFGPYGIVIDKKTSNLWIGDYEGSNVTRFDPSTGKFVEFPFPSRIQMIRFFGEDPEGRIWFTDFASGRIGVLELADLKTSSKQ